MTFDEIFAKFKKKYRKALLTSGAGFTGSHLAEELVTRGFPVISIDDYSAGKKINLAHLKKYRNFNEAKCDITDLKRLPRYFRGIDIVFHNAASKKSICLIDPRRDLEVNGAGTFNLLELSKKFKINKFIHASTGSVYGEAKPASPAGRIFPTSENHPLNPVSYYGVSKLAGEKYVQVFHHLYGLNTTVLRYFHVYGSRQEYNQFGGVVSIFLNNLLNNEKIRIFGSGKQERSFTYVKDIVKANLLCAIQTETNGEVYNCASGIKVTINELARHMLDYFAKGQKPIYKDWLIGDIKVFNIDNSKIKKLGLDFETDFFGRLDEILEEMKVYVRNDQKKSSQRKTHLRRF